MASSKATIEAVYKLQDKMSKELGTINKAMDKFQENAVENDKALKKNSLSFKKIATGVGAFAAAVGAVKLIKFGNELATIGANAELVAASFDKMAMDSGKNAADMLQNLRDASMGFVDDMTLQQSAMKASIAGIKFDDVTVAMEFVSKFALATGKDIGQAMETTMTGLARGSAQFMDDIGIMVMGSKDVVGDSIKQMKEKMGQFADVSETAAAKTKRLAAEMNSLKQEIGQSLIPAQAEALQLQADFFKVISENQETLASLAKGLATSARWLGEMAEGAANFIKQMSKADLTAGIKEQTSSYTILTNAINTATAARDAEVLGNEEKSKKLKTALAWELGAQGDYVKLMKELGVEISDTATDEINLVRVLKDKAEAIAIAIDRAETDKDLAVAAAAAAAKLKAETEGLTKTKKELAEEEKKEQIFLKSTQKILKEITDEQVAAAKFTFDFKKKGRSENLEAEAEFQESMAELKETAIENDKELREKELTELREFEALKKEIVVGSVTAAADIVSGIADAVSLNKRNNIDATERREIDAIKNSTKSEAEKAKAIGKIEDEAEKKKMDIMLGDWKRSILMIQVNTALGMAKTWATVGYPAAIPLTIAMGAASTVATATAMANKPKFEDGGRVGGNSFSGDKVGIQVNSGEEVVKREDSDSLKTYIRELLADKPSGGGGGNVFNINTMSSDGMEDTILNALMSAEQNNKVDGTVLSIGVQ